MSVSLLAEVRRIGLTGGIATGKSYVRTSSRSSASPRSTPTHWHATPLLAGTDGLAAVLTRFGTGVLDANGSLDRRKVAQIVFADANARRDLEAIIHPFVRRQADSWFRGLDPAQHAFAIADIPLLYETGTGNLYDAVIVTACAPEEQVRRIVARDHVTEAEARQRIAAQMPIEEKIRRGDYVIRTDGTHQETDRQVRGVFEQLSA